MKIIATLEILDTYRLLEKFNFQIWESRRVVKAEKIERKEFFKILDSRKGIERHLCA